MQERERERGERERERTRSKIGAFKNQFGNGSDYDN